MVKICAFCNKQIVWLDIFNCYYCQKQYCPDHSQPENHECPKIKAASNIERDWLRKKGQNITSAKYWAVCKQCGYKSQEPAEIEYAEKFRQIHINMKGCDSQKVVLRERAEDRQADEEFVQQNTVQKEADNWMYQCLAEAKSIIKRYHSDYDTRAFFEHTTYELYIQNDRENAYAYITLTENSNHFPIGIHPALSENNAQNQKMLVIILVHELLHAIHDREGCGHDKINPLERKLANLGGYFDALVELQNLALSGRMRFCNE